LSSMREALRNEMCTSLLPTPSPPSLPPSPPPASLGVRDLLVLQIIEYVLERLPTAISEEELRARRGGVADESSQFEPLAAFFIREVRAQNRSIKQLQHALTELQIAIVAGGEMASELQAARDDVYSYRVPKGVARHDEETLGSWLTVLLACNSQQLSWLQHGPLPSYSLAAFHEPWSFFVAHRQEVCCRRSFEEEGWFFNDLVNKFEVLSADAPPTEAPSDGVFIHGLWLDGARWDRAAGVLEDPEPLVRFSPLPTLHLRAVKRRSHEDAEAEPSGVGQAEQNFACEIFLYASRRRPPAQQHASSLMRMVVPLRTWEEPSVWRLRGVALLASEP